MCSKARPMSEVYKRDGRKKVTPTPALSQPIRIISYGSEELQGRPEQEHAVRISAQAMLLVELHSSVSGSAVGGFLLGVEDSIKR